MVQLDANGQQRARRKAHAKGGSATIQGRAAQIESRLNHGIRSRSPVLLHLESPQEWQQHLEGIRRSFDPGDEFEECLVHLIAYQLWCWIGRLLPYECTLTIARITTPENEFSGPSANDIQEVLTNSSEEARATLCARQKALVRFEALKNRDDASLFTKAEVEELIGWFVDRINSGLEDEDGQPEEADPDEQSDPEDEGPDIEIENRPWTVSEVQDELEILCDAADLDWREEFESVLYHQRYKSVSGGSVRRPTAKRRY